MNNPAYRIYPSLMDKFQKYLDSEQEFESFWNQTEDGEYKLTLDEICAKNEQELLDAINRVEHEESEAADKGTCFNEVIDCIIHNRKPERNDIRIEVIGAEGSRCIAAYKYADKDAEKEDFKQENYQPLFTFYFDIAMCRQVASMYTGALSQHYTQAVIQTSCGDVLLYGYIDEWLKDKVIDIKTSKNYEFGQFDNRWQRFVYPYCLTEEGFEINSFEFHMLKWRGGTKTNPVLSADFYNEAYTYNHQRAKLSLRQFLDKFICYIETNREKITNRRIFNVSD